MILQDDSEVPAPLAKPPAAESTPLATAWSGVRLRDARKGRNLTVADLAGKLNVSRWTVRAWERGGRPNRAHLDAIHAVLPEVAHKTRIVALAGEGSEVASNAGNIDAHGADRQAGDPDGEGAPSPDAEDEFAEALAASVGAGPGEPNTKVDCSGMRLGRALQHIRQCRGFTLRQLALRTGMSYSNLGNWESWTCPEIPNLEKLVRMFPELLDATVPSEVGAATIRDFLVAAREKQTAPTFACALRKVVERHGRRAVLRAATCHRRALHNWLSRDVCPTHRHLTALYDAFPELRLANPPVRHYASRGGPGARQQPKPIIDVDVRPIEEGDRVGNVVDPHHLLALLGILIKSTTVEEFAELIDLFIAGKVTPEEVRALLPGG